MSIVTLSSDLGFKGFKPPKDEQGSVHVSGGSRDFSPIRPSDSNQDLSIVFNSDLSREEGRTPSTQYTNTQFLIDRGSKFVKDGTFDSPGPGTVNQGFSPGLSSELDLDGKTPFTYQTNTALPDRGSIFVEGGTGQVESTDPTTFRPFPGEPSQATNQNFKISSNLLDKIVDPFSKPDPYSDRASSRGTTRGSNFVVGDENPFEGRFPTTFRPLAGDINQATNTNLEQKKPSSFNLVGDSNQNRYKDSSTFRQAIADREIGSIWDDFFNPSKTPSPNATFQIFGNQNLKGLKHYEGNGLGTIGTPLVKKEELPDTAANPYEYKSLSFEGRSRRDDLTRMSRLLVGNGSSRDPSGNRFTAKLALIATQTGIDAGIKAAANAREGGLKAGLSSALKAAGGGILNTGKVITGILAQTPVAGTGTHFIYAPAVNNQYLQKSKGGSALGNLAGAATGIGAGSGINGANEAYTRGKVTLPNEITLPEGSTAQPISIRANFFSETKDFSSGSFDLAPVETLALSSENDLDSKFFQDIIPFNFAVFTPSEISYIRLRAYLDDFSDTYTGEWNATKYVGRAENLYNYAGFDRNITFGFKIAALAMEELVPLYERLNTLVASTAPSYDETQSFMRGTFVKVTIGDYLKKIPGFFTSISLNWNTSYPWEIKAVGVEQTGAFTGRGQKTFPDLIIPTVLEVDMTFQPIHNFNPSYTSNYIGRVALA